MSPTSYVSELFPVLQVDVSITPGTHASEVAGILCRGFILCGGIFVRCCNGVWLKFQNTIHLNENIPSNHRNRKKFQEYKLCIELEASQYIHVCVQ